MMGSQAAGCCWEALIWSGNFPEWSLVLAPGVNHLKRSIVAGAIMVVLECWNGCGPVHSPAYIQKGLRVTSTNVTAAVAVRDQTMRTSFTQYNLLRTSHAVYFTKYERGVAFFSAIFEKLISFCF